MSNRFRRTVAGAGLVLSFALSVTPAAQAGPAKPSSRTVRSASPVHHGGLLTALWSYLVGTDPHGPKPTQGPTVDPNGIS